MIGKILRLPNEDMRKILLVALLLCLVCASVVSLAAVYLRPLQEANAELDRKKNILQAAGLMSPGINVEQRFAERIQTRMVDLETGRFTDALAVEGYDQRAASRNPAISKAIPADEDIASVRRRAQFIPVYLVLDDDQQLQQMVLPVHGYGLWSTMYGFLALGSDLNTVAGITFYSHGETPGLGGEIENPDWQAHWVGKQIFDGSMEPQLRVIKGRVDPTLAGAEFKIDGISGSTLTGNGLTNMLQYWLGENGFGPFLHNLKESGV